MDRNNNILKKSAIKSSIAIINRLNSEKDYNSGALYKKSNETITTWINFEKEAIAEIFSKKLKHPDAVDIFRRTYTLLNVLEPYIQILSSYEDSSFLWITVSNYLCKDISLLKRECIDNIYLKQEFELGQVYSELMIKFSDNTFGDAKKKLVLAERAWTVWSDSEIAWQLSSAVYGTELNAAQFKFNLTLGSDFFKSKLFYINVILFLYNIYFL